MLIYKATAPNGKVYVGQTISTLPLRMNQHRNDKRHTPFARALRKYGVDGFDWQIIAYADSQKELNEKEAYWIRALKTQCPRGYNLAAGGRNGKHSEATKRKIGNALRGRKKSAEHREALAANHKGFGGKKHSAATKDKMAAWQTGITRPPLSAEHRAKISDSLRGNNRARKNKNA